jgi:hypothetical protein
MLSRASGMMMSMVIDYLDAAGGDVLGKIPGTLTTQQETVGLGKSKRKFG